MAEYIERSWVVNWLKKVGHLLKAEHNHKEKTALVGKIIDHIENCPAVDVVEVVRGQWISAKDRLPTESEGTVLVCMPDVFPYNQKEPFVNVKHNRRVMTAVYSEHSGRWYLGDMMGVGGPDPIAWMPLPEPQKDGDSK